MLVRVSLVVNVDGEPDELEYLREVLVDAVRGDVEDDEFELEVVYPTGRTGKAQYLQWPDVPWPSDEPIPEPIPEAYDWERIARTAVDGYVISTVKLAGVALLFSEYVYETMVFPADSDGSVTSWTAVDSLRYDTEDAARLGHASLVAIWDAADSKPTPLS